MRRPALLPSLLLSLVILCLPGVGALGAESLDPPTGADAFAPRLTSTKDRLYLTWLEPAPGQEGAHRLRLTWREEGDGGWSDAVTIREGDDFFANWADRPGVAREPGGTLVAWWLQKLGKGTYAYGVRLAKSVDSGATWEGTGWLHEDTSPVEHGFVSMVPAGDRLQAFWLDGRGMSMGEDHTMAGGMAGAMTLRTAEVREGRPGSSSPLDERTCECCDTAAALASAGPVVVYRDRSETEIRDIGLVRWDARWTPPALVRDDGWEIAGCPVNGPAVAGEGSRVGIAWYTAADDNSRVQVAFSGDGGESFSPPIVVDEDRPVGRVGAAPAGSGDLWVVWLGREGTGGEVRLARVGAEGMRGATRSIAATSAERSAGVPSLAVFEDRPWIAWVDEPFGEPRRIRVTRSDRAQPPATAGSSSTNRR